MDRAARKALNIIRACLRSDRFLMLPHFRRRMTERGLVWPDVVAVVDAAHGIKSDGLDRFGRDKWLVRGKPSDGLVIEMVCVFDMDEHGNQTVLVTIY